MPGGNRVGRVYYDVDAENNVSKGLAAAEGEAQAFTDRISAMEAQIEVDADLSQLKKDAAEAKAIKEAMQSEFDDLNLDIGVKKSDIKRMREAGQETRKANGELAAMETRQNRLDHAIRRTTASQKAYSSQITSRTDEKRRIADAIKAEKEHARTIDNVTRSSSKEAFEVAKLEERYIKLGAARRKADQGIKGLHSTADRARLGRIQAERNLLREQMSLMGTSEEKLKSLDRVVDNDTDRWRRWGQSIAGTRVHLGFFSTTISGMLRLLVTFGPIVLSVLASLGSLISVAGAGVAGAFAVGGAALTGFGLAAVGVAFALRQPIHQLGVAWKASTAYADAVQKYGKGSTQAADKQSQLNNAIRGLPPQAQKAVKELGGMRTEFMKLGGNRIRADFFGSFAEGIKTASALLPTFARGSAQVFHQVSKGFDDWMKGLRGAESQNILKDIFQGAADFVPGLMAGLGNLASAFGRISQAGAHFLGGLGDGFQQWTQGIENAVGSGDQLTARVGRWVESMRKVGHFAQAATASLITFFGIGVGPGGGFLDSMTRSLQRWNKEMKANPKSIQEFFTQGIGLMEQLGPAVGRALITLAHAAQILSPAIEAAVTVLNQFFDIVSSIPGPVLSAVGAFYGLSKVLKLLTGIRIGGALLGLLGGSLVGRAGAAGVLGRILGGAAGTGGAAAATRQLSLFSSEAAVSTALLNPWTAALLAAGVGVGILAHNLANNRNNATKGTDALRGFAQATQAIPALMNQNKKAQSSAGDALARYNKLVKQGKGDSAAATAAIKEYSDSQAHARQVQEKLNFEIDKQHDHMTSLQDDYKAQQTVLEDTGRTNGKTSEEYIAQQKILAGIGAQLRLATLNYNRLHAGAAQASAGILKSLQGLKQLSNRKTALKFRFDDESVVAQANQLGQRLNRLGARDKVVKILANSDNATQAVGKLANLLQRLKDKRVKLSADDAASPRVQRIQSKIDALKDKKVRIQANDAASPQIARINQQIAALQDKTIHINAVYSSSGTLGSGAPHGAASRHYAGGMPSYATGGMTDAAMDRALNAASRRQALNGTDGGAKLTSPRFIAGEQAPKYNEYIITENPAFRMANLRWLDMAAQGLGADLIPSYASGGGPKASASKKKKKKSGAGIGQSLDDLTDENSPYQAARDKIDLDSGLADLVKRNYDLGKPGFSVQSVIDAIGVEIGDYRALVGVINAIINGKKSSAPIVDVPKIGDAPKQRKNEKDRDFNKRMATYNKKKARRDAAVAHNESWRTGHQSLETEMQDILQVVIPGLELDQYEAQNAAATNTILGAETSNLAREQLYRTFAGNIRGGAVAPSLGPLGLGSMASTPALTNLGAGATGSFSAAPAGAGTPPPAGDVTVNQTFAAPPPDPHTWARGVAFEIQAAG